MDIGRSFREATDTFFAFLPQLIGALVILVIGFVVAKVVSNIVRRLLDKAGVDRKLHESDAHQYVERVMPGASPSAGIGRVIFWIIFIFFLFSAIGALGIPALTTFMNQVLAYLPNVIVAIVIFLVAAMISGAIAAGVAKVMGDTPTGKIVAAVGPAVVMVIAMFMILEQLQIAPEIVRIAFAATMGALALGLALAFGLGGRGVAQRLLEDAYEKGRQQKDQVRSDVQQGRERVEAQAGRAQERFGSGDDSGSSYGAGSTYGSGSTYDSGSSHDTGQHRGHGAGYDAAPIYPEGAEHHDDTRTYRTTDTGTGSTSYDEDPASRRTDPGSAY